MKEIYLLGASGHGKVIAEIAELLNYQILGFLDANPSIRSLMEYNVSPEIPKTTTTVFISVGVNETRKKIVESNPNFKYPVLIHPKTNISKRSTLSEGTVVMAGVSINSDVKIGKQCIINTNASIDHDCIVSDYAHVSPNAALAGNVEVGEGTHIGIGACIIQGVKIGKWCTIGAGSVIIKDVPDNAVVVGNPGRILKFNK